LNPTLMLELKSPECGDSHQYEVRRVAINPDSKGTDVMLADEFPCTSCGHWVNFEFTSGTHMAISAELLTLTADNENGLAGQSKALSTPVVPYNGKRLPVSEVIARCKAAVATNPESIADWLRLGFFYHQSLSRPRYGLDYAERALDLEPNAVEGVFQKADALALQGDEAAAFQLLDQALDSKPNWRFFLTDVASPAQLTAQFANLYRNCFAVLAGPTEQACMPPFSVHPRRWGATTFVPAAVARSTKSAALQSTDPDCIR
jgi:hypothetical protein